MSIASAINTAVTIAQQNLGDLVKSATLRNVASRTYDAGQGKYVKTYLDTPISGVYDKFSTTEMQAEDFINTDLKFNVFNPENTLDIHPEDTIVIDGVSYAVRKADPVLVGGFKVLFQLVLRK